MLESATGLKFGVVPYLVHLFGPLHQFFEFQSLKPHTEEFIKSLKKKFLMVWGLEDGNLKNWWRGPNKCIR